MVPPRSNHILTPIIRAHKLVLCSMDNRNSMSSAFKEDAIVRILIVDDDPACRRTLKEALVFSNYRVLAVKDGRKALKIVEASSRKAEPVDLLMTDLQMPGMDGLELFESARQIVHGLSAVLITGSGNDQIKRRAMKSGFFGYLEKPFGLETLLKAIKGVRDGARKMPGSFPGGPRC
jgi:CheY-like chemotaxis protein